MHHLIKPVVIVLASLALAACAKDDSRPTKRSYVSLPEVLDPGCRDGKAKIYDECGDQLSLFKAALERANNERKTLLVFYGAEWCAWCHALDAHLNGEASSFRLTGDGIEAASRASSSSNKSDDSVAQLRELLHKSFVIVHIEAQLAPNGIATLKLAGAEEKFLGRIPLLFSVDSVGRYTTSLDHSFIRTSQEGTDVYCDFDRSDLLAQLAKILNIKKEGAR
jgi:thiol-disulfide isomerase/thioredoxin